MKKKAMFVVCAFGCASVVAQDGLTSKKGEAFLPEADDWCVSIDAVPFLNYAGRLLSGAGSTSPTWDWLNSDMTIIGKRFVDETTAHRAIVRLGFGSSKTTAMIGDAAVTTAPTFPAVPSLKEDEMKYSYNFIGIGAGMEKRRGSTRLQGIYGGDVMIMLSGEKESFSYGNALSTTVTVNGATTSSFSSSLDPLGSNMTTDTYGNTARYTEIKAGSMFGIGIRGFIGAEYFIMPKISIGGEFGWGLMMSSTGASSGTWESVDGGSGSVGSQTMEMGKSSTFGIDTDRNASGTATGALRLNLHF